MTAGRQASEERTLGEGFHPGPSVVHAAEKFKRLRVVAARFDGEDPLADRGREVVDG